MLKAADFAALKTIGWRDQDAALLPQPFPDDAQLARVVAQHRAGYEVHDGNAVRNAHIPPSLCRPGVSAEARPAVGDWVWFSPEADGKLLIRGALARRSALQRAAAGTAHRAQIIASNIDRVLIVCGLDGDFNPRRIERYLVIVHASGASALLLLTKADQNPQAASIGEHMQQLLGAATPVLTINAKSPTTQAQLAPWLQSGQTIVLVGSSGAGKSTLTNTLLGVEKMKTGAVRRNDSRGRHTTSQRALLRLPGGACLIDTPGMREIKLLGEEDLDAGSFADIEALASGCRFRDCAHGAEPGCAIQSALASGALTAAHYQNYHKLADEQAAALVRANAGAQHSAERAAHKPFHARLQEKYGKH